MPTSSTSLHLITLALSHIVMRRVLRFFTDLKVRPSTSKTITTHFIVILYYSGLERNPQYLPGVYEEKREGPGTRKTQHRSAHPQLTLNTMEGGQLPLSAVPGLVCTWEITPGAQKTPSMSQHKSMRSHSCERL
ncbi:hypothetical protein mRhiFer1_009840 [Rhinolophus ferrumequinum]|uniref:Uncharacterized protein n=1 Tax=Rhinolophus ferrumequinum TaxID=59479 RepID=A0A7J7YSA3_RHIFE|nr:hypothetical protein mRhiFer1_009840 [Rhinolophus ferrumequinum]